MATVLLGGLAGAEHVQVDLDVLRGIPVAGIATVPSGPHRLSVRQGARWEHRWLDVGEGETTVALEAGPLRHAGSRPGYLRHYPAAMAPVWAGLTRHMTSTTVACWPTVESHARTGDDLLAAIERSFLDGFLTPDEGDHDALACWRRSVALLAGHGPRLPECSPLLLLEAVETLGRQFELVGTEVLDDLLVDELDLLASELSRSVRPGLARAGRHLVRLLSR
jgi:hypothetical protein